MKSVGKILVILWGMLIVTSCSLNPKQLNEPLKLSEVIEEKLESETGHITRSISENLDIDADIDFPSNKEYAIYCVERKKFSQEYFNLFLSEEDSERTIFENPNYPRAFVVETGRGSDMGIKDGYLNYQRRMGYDHEVVAMIEGRLMIEEELFYSENNGNTKELSFQSKEEAIRLGESKIKEVLDCQLEEIRTVALDHRDLKNLQDDLLKKDSYKTELENGTSTQIGEWSEEDDVYYIQYILKQDDLPIHNAILEPQVSMSIDVFWSFPVNITVLVDKDGISYFNFRNALDGLGEIKEKKTIITANEALEKIEEIYNNIILTDKTTISKIWLEYIPVPNWKDTSQMELRPYWCIQIDTVNIGGEKWSQVERINAITGGNLSYGE